ncbi:MAG TPA: hypothetical protein VFU67_08585 [Nitrososphaeraceae archaeon]|jgi:hypothetical protein|nr:hypothetical protein [Nitrososphaeraceae archaeon]
MSSKVDQLENQPDLAGELRDFLRNFGSNKERDEAIMGDKNKDKSRTNMEMIDSNKILREKINIEIDLYQRTTVFSSDPSMWI